MLNENLKTIRKNKGFSQEQLSLRLNVVRQTVSKWEKGLSVPDAEMLAKIAEVLDVSTSELLGGDITVEQRDSLTMVAQELQKMNELMTMQQERRRNMWKKAGRIAAVVFFLLFALSIFDEWGELWREFGRNLYWLIHG